MLVDFGRKLGDLSSTHRDRSTQKSLGRSWREATAAPVSHLTHPFWASVLFSALSEMESMLLSVVKDRKSQRKKCVFVDTLLQSTLTERQVRAPETPGTFP